MTKTAYLEVSGLLETEWTGVVTVIAGLTRLALDDPSIEWRFLNETLPLPRPLTEKMLADRSGTVAQLSLTDGLWDQPVLSYEEASKAKAVFTNIKPMRGLFADEAIIVHDLTPLLTPEFHNIDTIGHFANRFRSDIETSSHFFPVSKATRDDLRTYFGVPHSACTIVQLGLDFDLFHLSLAQEIARSYQSEPYVVVLATLEPRKNGRIVLEYLARNPGFANRFRVVFIGREGWLEERKTLLEHAARAGVPRDRVIFTGFVSEQEKISLLYNCSFCIYASFFEGYGLPILEAAVLGKLIVCSNTSSMPEVSPAECYFFDPRSLLEFSRAVSLAEKRALQVRPSVDLAEGASKLADHGWEDLYDAVRPWVPA